MGLRVGIVSAGLIGARAQVIMTPTGADVTAVADVDADRAHRVAEPCGPRVWWCSRQSATASMCEWAGSGADGLADLELGHVTYGASRCAGAVRVRELVP